MMMESMLISIGVIVAIAVVGICAFFLCTRTFPCCERKNAARAAGQTVGNDVAGPDVAVISDDQGHVFVVNGINDGIPSQLHWKPPEYADIVELPTYDEAILNVKSTSNKTTDTTSSIHNNHAHNEQGSSSPGVVNPSFSHSDVITPPTNQGPPSYTRDRRLDSMSSQSSSSTVSSASTD